MSVTYSAHKSARDHRGLPAKTIDEQGTAVSLEALMFIC